MELRPLQLLVDDVEDEDETMDEDETFYLLRDEAAGRVGRSGGKKSFFPDFTFLQKFRDCCRRCFVRQHHFISRTIPIGQANIQKFPHNIIRNQKYSIWTFLPFVLLRQFSVFMNLFFLVMALSQLIPVLRVGQLYTYWGPLSFVVAITLIREALDEWRRYKRDQEVNSQEYTKITRDGAVRVPSSAICVGDLIQVEKDQRVPADMVLIRTTEQNGTTFIRTDQLDGETDWKLRIAVAVTQNTNQTEDLFNMSPLVFAEAPKEDIHSFLGTFSVNTKGASDVKLPLNLENTLWTNTVIASGTALGVVIYTGCETRSAMNNSAPRSKTGLVDMEVNQLTKILCVAMFILAFVMSSLLGFYPTWVAHFFRFILLFSYMIPLSLRVNLDMAKTYYSWVIQHDRGIAGTVVRSTTIPEELGRIRYLLSDKTGTLTRNDMVLKRIHVGEVGFNTETFHEVRQTLLTDLESFKDEDSSYPRTLKRELATVEAVTALAVCHQVTPSYDNGRLEYQASSPDEVALVSWADKMGLRLVNRGLHDMQIEGEFQRLDLDILETFPFTSERKRMGIIVRDKSSKKITFYMKGADVVMCDMVHYNDWMKEEIDNMARQGLRTLVVAKKELPQEVYQEFQAAYRSAQMSISERASRVENVVRSLEREMDLLCVTGVEDQLQSGVKQTLETLRQAGIKVWMLTGDKQETAACIAKSSCLADRHHDLFFFADVTTRPDAHTQLNALTRKKDNSVLIIKGQALETCLKYYEQQTIELARECPAVVVCRCTPTLKAQVVQLLQKYTGQPCAAIGDGGNDVSMIQAANAGIGIVGKEGRQASLAADFSIDQFCYLQRLLFVHGRRSYRRTAALSQFVIHRGLIIAIMQAVFSASFYFSSIALYQGALMVGYATVYTMFPVFSLVLDMDVSDETALQYPELYKMLSKGRSLSFKTFLIWVFVSFYQGCVLMYMAFLLFESQYIHIVQISFSALVLSELIMVALITHHWHYLMVMAEVVSLVIYAFSILFLKDTFELAYFRYTSFYWKVILLTLSSCLPLVVAKYIYQWWSPPTHHLLDA